MNRRRFLALAGSGLASAWARGLPAAPAAAPALSPSDDAFLHDLQRRCLSYFIEKTDPTTGLTLDRGCVNGGPYTLDERPTASATVTGFGLAALCVAAERRWIGAEEARQRAATALRFLARRAPHERGWFYHWMHYRTGARADALAMGSHPSEVSTIDSAFLLGGILTAARYFAADPEIAALGAEIYRRVDFPWMLDPRTGQLRHGWTPEGGYIPYLWDEYAEASLLYLLAIGSPTQPIPPASWYAWKRNAYRYGPYRYIGTAPLFTHQYSQVFLDLRGLKERNGASIDWFENSVTATRAHRQFCIDLAPRFPDYSPEVWGIVPSRSRDGYTNWGGPPMDPRIDGTVVPGAAAGSLMFTPDICLPALRTMHRRYGDLYCRYGFTDAFNPVTGWNSPDVTGLNLGITFLSAENLRTGNLWRWFMANPEPRRALELAGVN